LERDSILFGDGKLVALKDLQKKHIVASADLGAEILKITGQIRSKHQVKPKRIAHVLIPMIGNCNLVLVVMGDYAQTYG
jgi:hypothetical protein